MEHDILLPILLQLILISLNAVFACAEIAVISMNDNKLAQLVSQGDKRALRLARLTSRPAQFLATIQIAITLSGFLGSAFAADNFSDRLTGLLLAAGVWCAEFLKLVKAAVRNGLHPTDESRLRLSTCRNIVRSIFTRKTPKELFTLYYNQLRSQS